MRITELFTAQSIALDEAQQDRSQIIDRLVELQATHGNIRDKEAYKKGLYAREDEGSTYVDNGITVPHAKCDCVTRPSLAALRLKTPVQYNAEDDGKTDLLFAIAAPKNGSLHVDMLARMMQMLMNEDFVEKLRTAKTPEDFLAAIDAQEEAQFGDESFTDQEIEQAGYRVLAVTACVNGIAHTYMAAEALEKAGAELYYPDGRVPVTRMSDVDKSIVELLGLNHKQFTQITMIAQGQFRKFLDTNTDERSKIFRDLFHTYFFQQLQDRLKQDAAAKHNEFAEQQRRSEQALNGISCIYPAYTEQLQSFAARHYEGCVEEVLALVDTIIALDEKEQQQVAAAAAIVTKNLTA